MAFAKTLSLLLLIGSWLGAQAPIDDPVMKARAQRAQAQGIREADLPPMPRSVTEPPPLPPPEIHLKDTRGGRVTKSQRKAKALAVKGKGHKAAVKGRKKGSASTEAAEPAAPKRAARKNTAQRAAKHAPKASAKPSAKHSAKAAKKGKR